MALKGIKVIELAGLAPVPLCGMILSDFGARVISVDKDKQSMPSEICSRGKESMILNLKRQEHHSVFKQLVKESDVLLDPYRPGTLEKLSLSPSELREENPRLVVARLSGYGQPTSASSAHINKAGHDINYLALSGVLSCLGHYPDPPSPPVNLLADFAGGSLLCSLGIVMALLERERTGQGQVIDASMTEGNAYLSSFLWRSRDVLSYLWGRPRGQNVLDGGMHFYRVYPTKDRKYMAVGALEPQFYSQLLEGLGLSEEEAPQFGENSSILSRRFAEIFATRTRDEWCQVFDKLDACVTPVLGLDEAPVHPLHRERRAYLKANSLDEKSEKEEVWEPAPAPRMSAHKSMTQSPNRPRVGEHTESVLKELGYSIEEVEHILSSPSKAKPKL